MFSLMRKRLSNQKAVQIINALIIDEILNWEKNYPNAKEKDEKIETLIGWLQDFADAQIKS